MTDRLSLQSLLQEIMGNYKVYYQAPSVLEYPCIKYEKSNYDTRYSNNNIYKKKTHYTITLIGKESDNDNYINLLLNIPYCSFDRRFVSDNLYHDVFDLYY